jgi:TonB-linked SusC/RagA family outer membrane protein
MNRLALSTFLLVLPLTMVLFPHDSFAQHLPDSQTESRAPRFLLALAGPLEDGRATLGKRLAAAMLHVGSIVGTVTSAETGARLSGATVSVVGTRISAASDAEGRYRLTGVPAGTQQLHAQMLGYAPADTSVVVADGRETVVDLELEARAVELQALVAVGYGEKSRQDLTGAIASVGAEAIESRPVISTLAALQGVVPNLIIQRYSGQPGVESFDINLRGASSTNGGNTPLVLIDGIPGNLDLLNPADIESISILKDAAASIYGARAADGALLVTTKAGSRAAPTFTYSSNAAITRLQGMMDTPNHYQFAIMDNEANIHNGAAPMYTPELLEHVRTGDPNPIPHPVYGSSGWMLFFPSTDWRRAVFENGFQHKQTLTVSGGGQNSRYYFSGTYADQRGVIRDAADNNKRYNLRLNYDYDISSRFRLESKLSLDNQDRTDIGGIGSQGVIVEAIFGMPNHPIYTSSGTRYFAQGGWGNAVAQSREAATADFTTRSVNTNVRAIVDLSDLLELNLQSGINYRSTKSTDIGKGYPLYRWDESAIAYYSIANPDRNWLFKADSAGTYRNYLGYLRFHRLFGGRHAVEVVAGGSHEDEDTDWFGASRTNFASQDVWGLGLGSTDDMSNDGGGQQWAIRSLFSRLSYAFANRYMLDATLRYDGSSRFHPDKRWGLFPGISLGWRLSDEAFMRDLVAFDNLTLRASYGETGNQEGIGLYDYLQVITIGKEYPFGEGGRAQSAFPAGMVSTSRTWETIATRNIGVDATMLSSRLDVTFDYFVKTNRNMLIPVTYPSLLGAVPPFSNAGELKTWGFETSVGWKGTLSGLTYSATATLSDARTRVVNYGGQDTYVLGWNNVREGYPVNTYFGFQFDGLIRSQEELDAYKQLGGVPSDIGIGDARFKDINGDGKISIYGDTPGDDGDVIDLGSAAPRYTYGLNLGAQWKSFDLGIFLQGVAKRTLLRDGDYRMPWSDWWRQPPLFYYGKTWNEDRPDAPYPRLSHGNIRFWNYQPSTLQVVDAAYLRLKNLQIGYALPAAIIGRVGMSRARMYFSGLDLWEKHGVKGGWDPESASHGFNYPFQRFYSIGMDITF